MNLISRFLKKVIDFSEHKDDLSGFEGLRVLSSHYDSYLEHSEMKQGISFDFECYYYVTEGNFGRIDLELRELKVTNINYFKNNQGKRLTEKEEDILYKIVEYKLNDIL